MLTVVFSTRCQTEDNLFTRLWHNGDYVKPTVSNLILLPLAAYLSAVCHEVACENPQNRSLSRFRAGLSDAMSEWRASLLIEWFEFVSQLNLSLTWKNVLWNIHSEASSSFLASLRFTRPACTLVSLVHIQREYDVSKVTTAPKAPF